MEQSSGSQVPKEHEGPELKKKNSLPPLQQQNFFQERRQRKPNKGNNLSEIFDRNQNQYPEEETNIVFSYTSRDSLNHIPSLNNSKITSNPQSQQEIPTPSLQQISEKTEINLKRGSSIECHSNSNSDETNSQKQSETEIQIQTAPRKDLLESHISPRRTTKRGTTRMTQFTLDTIPESSTRNMNESNPFDQHFERKEFQKQATIVRTQKRNSKYIGQKLLSFFNDHDQSNSVCSMDLSDPKKIHDIQPIQVETQKSPVQVKSYMRLKYLIYTIAVLIVLIGAVFVGLHLFKTEEREQIITPNHLRNNINNPEVEQNSHKDPNAVDDPVKCYGKNRDFQNGCECFPGYFAKEGEFHCSGPFTQDIPFTREDALLSFAGQENNFVTRIMKKWQIEFFSYQLDTIQKTQVGGNWEKDTTSVIHELGIVTTDVTNTTFTVLMYFMNTTYIQSEDDQSTLQGYPTFYQPRNDTTTTKETLDLDSIPFSKWQEKEMSDYNLTKLEMLSSTYPIIKAEVKKTGEIVWIQHPINFDTEKKNLLPTILNLYSPPLTTDKFSQVVEHIHDGSRRRFLKDTDESNKPVNEQPGPFGTESPEFKADVDPETNEAKINKQYGTKTESSDGKTTQQESTFDSNVNMKDGRIDKAQAKGNMGLTSPKAQDDGSSADNFVEKDIVSDEPVKYDGETPKDGELEYEAPEPESKPLMGPMVIESENNFQFKKIDILKEEDVNKILEDFEKNHLKKRTFDEFQQDIYEETELDNQIDLVEEDGGVGDYDPKRRNLGFLDSYNDVVDKDIQAKVLLPTRKVTLFRKDLYGMEIALEKKITCYHPRNPEDKDDKEFCTVIPILSFAGSQWKVARFEIKVPLSDMIKKLNWVRYHVVYKTEEVIKVIDTGIKEMIDEIKAISDKAENLLDLEKNLKAQKVKDQKEEFKSYLAKNYHLLEDKIKELVDAQRQKMQPDILLIKLAAEDQMYSFSNKIDYVLSNFESSFIENLDELSEVLSSQSQSSPLLNSMLESLLEEFTFLKETQLSELNMLKQLQLNQYIIQPINKLISTFTYLQVNPSSQEVDKVATNMANNYLSNSIISDLKNIIDQKSIQYDEFTDYLKLRYSNIFDQIEQRLNTLITETKGKENSSYSETKENIEKIADLISFSKFTHYKDLNFEETKALENSGIILYSQQLLQSFTAQNSENSEMKLKVKKEISDFIVNMEADFKKGSEDLHSDISEMVDEIREELENIIVLFGDMFFTYKQKYREVMMKLMDVLMNGNPNGDKIDKLGDFQDDWDSIQNQVRIIKGFKGRVQDIVAEIQRIYQIPSWFDGMQQFVDNSIAYPFDAYQKQTLNLHYISHIDERDFRVYKFDEAFEELQDELAGSIENSIQKDLREIIIDRINEKIKEMLQKFLDFFDIEILFPDLQKLFFEIMKKLLLSLQFDKITILDKPIFNKNEVKTLYYPVSLGTRIYIQLKQIQQINLKVDLGLTYKKIDFSVGINGKYIVSAEGGIDWRIVRAGVYMDALIFQGNLESILDLRIKGDNYKGIYLLQFQMDALNFKFGIFVSYRTLETYEECTGGWISICFPFIRIIWSDKVDLITPYTFSGIEY